MEARTDGAAPEDSVGPDTGENWGQGEERDWKGPLRHLLSPNTDLCVAQAFFCFWFG